MLIPPTDLSTGTTHPGDVTITHYVKLECRFLRRERHDELFQDVYRELLDKFGENYRDNFAKPCYCKVGEEHLGLKRTIGKLRKRLTRERSFLPLDHQIDGLASKSSGATRRRNGQPIPIIPGSSGTSVGHDLVDLFGQALDSLSDEDRQMLEMLRKGMSNAEIADHFGWCRASYFKRRARVFGIIQRSVTRSKRTL